MSSSAPGPANVREITREVARYAVHSSFAALPDFIRAEAARAFLNWMGCVIGGSREDSTRIAAATVLEEGGAPQSSLIGHGKRTNVASAAFVNSISASALAFDDTHLATVTHPTAPVAAALFAHAERAAVTGEEFLNAVALGIEIQCRLSNVLLMPPAQANLGLYVTGISGPVGTAVALGRLLRLDEQKMRWAIGLAVAMASGLRSTHGSMGGAFVPGQAARTGVSAAMLAAGGFTCGDRALEGPKGFVEVFGRGGNLDLAVEGLGRQFELMANAYKPYPYGIVVHAAIDACMEIVGRIGPADAIADVHLTVPPLTLELAFRRHPKDMLEAQVALYHLAAACLLQREAGVAQSRQASIDDPAVTALRERITATADPKMARDEAAAEVTLADGRRLRSHVAHARGSITRPMTDAELDAKFTGLAATALAPEAGARLLRLCRDTAALDDVGKTLSAVWTR